MKKFKKTTKIILTTAIVGGLATAGVLSRPNVYDPVVDQTLAGNETQINDAINERTDDTSNDSNLTTTDNSGYANYTPELVHGNPTFNYDYGNEIAYVDETGESDYYVHVADDKTQSNINNDLDLIKAQVEKMRDVLGEKKTTSKPQYIIPVNHDKTSTNGDSKNEVSEPANIVEEDKPFETINPVIDEKDKDNPDDKIVDIKEDDTPKEPTISPEVAALLEKIDLANNRVNDAKDAVALCETDLANAKKAYEDAKDQNASDIKKLDELKALLDEKSAALADAKVAYENAVNTYNEVLANAEDDPKFASLKKDVEDRTVALATSMDARDNALAAVNEAKANYESAKAVQDEKIAAVEDKKIAKEDAEKLLADAELELEAAKKDLQWKIFGRKEAKQAVKDAEDAVATAQSNYDNAVKDLETAKSEVVSSQTDLTAYKKAVEDAEKAVSDAQTQIALGSYGFFEEYATEDSHALTILNMVVEYQNSDQWLTDTAHLTDEAREQARTVIGDEKDATSLENMKRAIAFIREGNELRTTDDNFQGLNELLVTDAMMASAQVNANASYDVKPHWAWLRNNGYQTGENTALGWEDAYDGWYDIEKQVYDYLAVHPELSIGKNAQEIADALDIYVGYVQTGHYEGLTYNRYILTGFGIDDKGLEIQTQEFGYRRNPWLNDETYTVDEYESRFMEYYNKVNNALTEAQTQRDKAKADLERIQNNASNATAEYERKVAEAEYKVALVEKAVMDAEDDLQEAEATLIKKEAEVAAQETVVTDKENNVTTAETEVANAQEEIETAEAELTEATIVVTETEVAVEDAEEVLATTKQDVTEKQEDLDEANTALNEHIDTMNEEVKDARDAVVEAEAVVEDAQNAADNTEAEITTQETVVDESMEALSKAEESVNYAQEKLDEAYVELENAETEKTALEQEYVELTTPVEELVETPTTEETSSDVVEEVVTEVIEEPVQEPVQEVIPEVVEETPEVVEPTAVEETADITTNEEIVEENTEDSSEPIQEQVEVIEGEDING